MNRTNNMLRSKAFLPLLLLLVNRFITATWLVGYNANLSTVSSVTMKLNNASISLLNLLAYENKSYHFETMNTHVNYTYFDLVPMVVFCIV